MAKPIIVSPPGTTLCIDVTMTDDGSDDFRSPFCNKRF